MTPKRRLRYDLLSAAAALPLAILLGLLLHEDLTGYPLTFGATFAVARSLLGARRYLIDRHRR